MSRKKLVRVVLDTLLTATIILAMLIQFTGEFLHEIIGCIFFAALVTHLALSAKWMKGTMRARREGKLHGRRRALGVMACLLAVAMVMLGMSSVAISWVLEDAGFVWPLGPYALWETIHAVSSYSLCVLVVVHLAMHWTFFASAFKVPYDPSRRQAIGTGVKVVAAAGAVAIGVVAAKEILPRQIAQASNATATAGGSSENDRTFAAVADTPYDESVNTETSGRRDSDPVAEGSDPSSVADQDETPTYVEEVPAEDAYSYDASIADGGGYADDGIGVDAGEYAVAEEAPLADYDYTPVESEADETPQNLGNCPLCRKNCPLNAPQCNRPYDEGLI